MQVCAARRFGGASPLLSRVSPKYICTHITVLNCGRFLPLIISCVFFDGQQKIKNEFGNPRLRLPTKVMRVGSDTFWPPTDSKDLAKLAILPKL